MIGAQIAAYRKQKDLTQEQLGEMLGVSNRTVSKWESETSLPGVDMIPNIAEALGVTLDALFGIRSDPDEKGLSDLLRDIVRQELESLLPDAVENAIQKSCGNLPQPEKYELIIMSKDRSCFTKTCGEAGIVSDNTSGKWLVNVITSEGRQTITVAVCDTEDEAKTILKAIMDAYSGRYAKIVLG